jgi:hypothetical protein
MKNGGEGNMTTQNRIATKQDDLQELEIDRVTFVKEPNGWKVFESGSWEEWKHGASEYGTVANDGDGFLAFNPNFVCYYPLVGGVLQAIATFINRQNERDSADYGLTTLGP